jgi:hypothetical protein
MSLLSQAFGDTLMTTVDSVMVARITGKMDGREQDQLRVKRVLIPSPPSDTCQTIAVYTPLHIHLGWLLGRETLRKSSTRRVSFMTEQRNNGVQRSKHAATASGSPLEGSLHSIVVEWHL